jgi:uncharacterized protein YhaN
LLKSCGRGGEEVRIKRLHIADVGIIRNQTLENIAPGVIVIGGLNRSGKSTFLQILRSLGYGFSRSDALPPAMVKYEVEADLICDSGEIYNLHLNGYGEPVVRCIHGAANIVSARELYKVDSFTYRQLFTISIDELQRKPVGLSGSQNDIERLQSVLLGAGLSDILNLPMIEEELQKEAEKIGGKNGNPAVKQFKPYNQQIRAGLDMRQKALEQVEEYREKQRARNEIEKKIASLEHEVEYLGYKITLLDILKTNYELWVRKRELQQILDSTEKRDLRRKFSLLKVEKIRSIEKQYRNLLDKYSQLELLFQAKAAGNKVVVNPEKLIEYREELRGFYQQLSGFEERYSVYQQLKSEYQKRSAVLVQEAKELNDNWDALKIVLKIRTDQRELDALNQAAVAYNDLQQEIGKLKERCEELQDRREALEREQKFYRSIKPDISLKKFLYAALFFAAGGSLLSFFFLWPGILSGFAGMLGAALYVLFRYMAETNLRAKEEELRAELERIETLLFRREKKLDYLNREIQGAKRCLDYFRHKLDLPEEASPELIKETFWAVKALKEKILECQRTGSRITESAAALQEELLEMASVLGKIYGFHPLFRKESDHGIIEQQKILKEKIIELLKEAMDYLTLVQELKECETEKRTLEKEIFLLQEDMATKEEAFPEEPIYFLQYLLAKGEEVEEIIKMQEGYRLLEQRLQYTLKTERVRGSLEAFFQQKVEDEGLLGLFDKFSAAYTSAEDASHSYNETLEKCVRLGGFLNELKEKRRLLNEQLQGLATADSLVQAQRKIDENRGQLRPLAEKYAVYKTASFLLKEMQRQFMERKKDNLLEGASRILERLTAGDYTKILLPDQLMETDFKIQGRDGILLQTADTLSRGTKEQLFLAVRLSRIKEIGHPLPVILDDSLVNFDFCHQEQAAQILSSLAGRHQMFVLTCHPQLVLHIANHSGKSAQYWKLEEGRFSLSNKEELAEHLSSGIRKH